MGGLSVLKQKTVLFKRKIAAKTKSFRMRRYGRMEEEASTAEDLPLLKTANTKSKTNAWGGADVKDMADFAAASAAIAITFSVETKSSNASDLYRAQRSPKEGRVEFPVLQSRDMNKSHKTSDHYTKEAIAIEKKPSFASYSISGSMLCTNIENGRIKENSTSAATKKTSPHIPTGLPPTAVAASSLFRSMNLTTAHVANTKRLTGPAPQQNLYVSRSVDSVDEEDSPYVTIKRPGSKDGAQSSVSSVTMYSTYQNDAMVRASNNLLDILRSNKFENFSEDKSPQALCEA
jgi:hypothetical protein